ncbi:MAG: PTPA-CTERM sorting domain-containing protein [Cyanobacteria bacterium P01_F01_bin.116]
MFKLSARFGIAAVSLLAFSAAPATAAQFTASYDFGGPATDGDVFTFDFEGVINSNDDNLIEGVSSLSNFQLGGVPVFDPGDPGIFGGPFSVILDVLSFDGTANSFTATNPGATDGIAFQNAFGALIQSNAGFGPSGFSISESFDTDRWSVVGPPPTAVPTPATLPGVIIGMGFALWRKRNLAQSDQL